MILIYNLKGALVTLAGLMVGILLVFIFRSLTLGVIGLVVVWCKYGRAGIDEETGEAKPAGSVFFIPMFTWGILFGVLGLPVGLLFDFAGDRADNGRTYVRQNTGERSQTESYRHLFNSDERGLESNESDDLDMSSTVSELVSVAFPDSEKSVRIKSSADSVLILIQMPDLKRIKNEDRETLLNLLKTVAEELRPGVKVYAGLKGNSVFGAIAVPGSSIKTGKIVSETPLYAFYTPPTLPVTLDDNRIEPKENNLDSPSDELPELESNSSNQSGF